MMRWGRAQYRTWTSGAHVDHRGRPVTPPADGYDADLCPIVWINLPAGATSSGVDRQILNFFGLPWEGAVAEFTNRAIRAARRHQAQVLIVDDAHLLKTDCKSGRVALDHIKHLNTELGYIDTTLVVVGANLEDGDLVNDPQIAGRLKMQTASRTTSTPNLAGHRLPARTAHTASPSGRQTRHAVHTTCG